MLSKQDELSIEKLTFWVHWVQTSKPVKGDEKCWFSALQQLICWTIAFQIVLTTCPETIWFLN